MSGANRIASHDNEAVPMVVAIFKRYGFESYRVGFEHDDPDLKQALASQSDPTSIMLRFRPDRLFVKRGLLSVMCEVKHQKANRSDFSIEIDSYHAARQWNSQCNNLMYGFVDFGKQPPMVTACWGQDIPVPRIIIVPMRWDYEERLPRLSQQWPQSYLSLVDHNNGSGTPYFWMPKTSSFLMPIDTFICERLLSQRVVTL